MELKKYLKQEQSHILNLGCGRTKPPEHFGIDIMDVAGVDMVADLSKGIPVPDKSFDIVMAIDFLEHIPNGDPCVKIMEESYRVLKPGGEFHFLVPSTDGNSVGAFQDPYHVSFWNKTKFNYFLEDAYGNNFRALYGIKCFFKPKFIDQYYNDYGVTYVRGILIKPRD